MRQDTSLLESPQPYALQDERHLTREAIALEETLRALVRAAKTSDCASTKEQTSCNAPMAGLLSARGPINPVAIQPGLAETHALVDAISEGTTRLLEAQAMEHGQLLSDHQSGAISDRALKARLADMRQSRVALADALSLSITQAERARKVLERASANGQTGLGWYEESLRAVETRAAVVQDRLVRTSDPV